MITINLQGDCTDISVKTKQLRMTSKHSHGSNIQSRVESPYNMQYLIRKKVCNCLALVNTETFFLRMLLFWN